MATLQETAKILGGLAILYPRFQLERATITAYHRIVGDLPADILDAAALEIGRTNTFFPAAAELRKAAFKLMRVANKTPNAQDAWAEVCRSFGSHGRYRGAPDWSHPLIADSIAAIGGYAMLCNSENPMADRARFVQAFEAYSAREQDLTEMLPQVRDLLPRLVDGNGHKQLSSG